jgi:positive regulator of sigma E activity
MSRCDAVVKEVDADMALIELSGRPHACGSCARVDGCGSGLLGLGTAPRRYWLKNSVVAHPGDVVSVMVTDGTLLRTSLVAYLLPALLAIAGAATGDALGGDAAALAGMFAGLVTGVLWLRYTELRTRAGNSFFSLQRETSTTHLYKDVS